MKLSKETPVIVTGGASGLGQATARAFAAAGVPVAIFDINDELGKTVAEEIDGTYHHVNILEEESVIAGFVNTAMTFFSARHRSRSVRDTRNAE